MDWLFRAFNDKAPYVIASVMSFVMLLAFASCVKTMDSWICSTIVYGTILLMASRTLARFVVGRR